MTITSARTVPRRIYRHRELPPEGAQPLGDHEFEAISASVRQPRKRTRASVTKTF